MALVVVTTEPESVGGESWVTVGADCLLSLMISCEFSAILISPAIVADASIVTLLPAEAVMSFIHATFDGQMTVVFSPITSAVPLLARLNIRSRKAAPSMLSKSSVILFSDKVVFLFTLMIALILPVGLIMAEIFAAPYSGSNVHVSLASVA
jgi:hypothetical protein